MAYISLFAVTNGGNGLEGGIKLGGRKVFLKLL